MVQLFNNGTIISFEHKHIYSAVVVSYTTLHLEVVDRAFES